MRKDDKDNLVPTTLGEYLGFCKRIAPNSKAVRFLEEKIANARNGADEIVEAEDVQMRSLLIPMLKEE